MNTNTNINQWMVLHAGRQQCARLGSSPAPLGLYLSLYFYLQMRIQIQMLIQIQCKENCVAQQQCARLGSSPAPLGLYLSLYFYLQMRIQIQMLIQIQCKENCVAQQQCARLGSSPAPLGLQQEQGQGHHHHTIFQQFNLPAVTKQACLSQYLSNSTKMTTNTEMAMLSSCHHIELPDVSCMKWYENFFMWNVFWPASANKIWNDRLHSIFGILQNLYGRQKSRKLVFWWRC